MGNLELSHIETRSPYSRKPIFNNSLSPCPKSSSLIKARNPRPYLNRSTIQGRYCDRSSSPLFSNKVYIDSNMLKSVIKDSNDSKYSVTSFSRLMKNKKSDLNYSCIDFIKTPKQNKQTSRQRYTQRPMEQKSSGKIKHSSFSKPFPIQKQNEQSQFNNISLNKISIEQRSTLPLFCSKFPNNISNIGVKSGNSTGKITQLDSKNLIGEKPNCNCYFHKNLTQFKSSEHNHLIYDAPTERKRPFQINYKISSRQPQFQTSQNKQNTGYQTPQLDNSDTMEIQKQSKYYANNSRNANREKCQEIIKRVRNFNQFLNQVKKKIKKQVDLNTSQNNTMSNISMNENQSIAQVSKNNQENSKLSQFNEKNNTNHSKSITMALRLQNQKIQLEKYRKLVERQLSKQHSIQSIGIQAGKNKKKIITINFQKKIERKMEINLNQPIQVIQKIENISIKSQNEQQNFNEKVAKEVAYQKQQKTAINSQNMKKQKQLNKRVNNINKLMNKIEGIHKVQNCRERQILEQFQKDCNKPSQEYQ